MLFIFQLRIVQRSFAEEQIIIELPRKPSIEDQILQDLRKKHDGAKDDGQFQAEDEILEHGASVMEPTAPAHQRSRK
ncbi:hypothetical protein [Herbaspirillum rubrisubalbicans]|uniref:hypothetical protein n=1 Tax=Herbaspirillum rubrisubalbicans TaxID=80842 RepID=UPI0012E6F5B3|nr:hypothetical protein [Herbaspirillum rubrisubalbicans]